MPTVERIDHDTLHATLVIHVPKEEYAPKLDAEMRKLRQKVQMKGFRPGHTPLTIVKKFYGQQVMVDTINDLTVKELQRYLANEKLKILYQPISSEEQEKLRFDISNMQDMSFRFDIGLSPNFEIKGLDKSDSYERMTVLDIDDLVEKDLSHSRRRAGERTNPTDLIEAMDIVKINAFEINPDGSKKEGGLETIMTTYVENVESKPQKDALMAAKAGDTLRFNPRDLDRWADEKLYRKYILGLEEGDTREVGDAFEGTIEEVSRLAPAAMNQAFFDKLFGENAASSESEARELIGKRLLTHYSSQADALLMQDLQIQLLEKNQFDLPENFLKKWIKLNQTESDHSLSDEQLDHALPLFLKTIRWSLIRDVVMNTHNISVTDADIEAAFAEQVRGYFGGQSFVLPEGLLDSAVKRLMADDKQVEEVENNLTFEKMFAAMRDQVTIIDKPVPSSVINDCIAAANRASGSEQDDDD